MKNITIMYKWVWIKYLLSVCHSLYLDQEVYCQYNNTNIGKVPKKL